MVREHLTPCRACPATGVSCEPVIATSTIALPTAAIAVTTTTYVYGAVSYAACLTAVAPASTTTPGTRAPALARAPSKSPAAFAAQATESSAQATAQATPSALSTTATAVATHGCYHTSHCSTPERPLST